MNDKTQHQANPNIPTNDNAASPQETADFINEKELLKRLPVSRRTLFSWRTSGKIPSVRLGGRRILFHWPSVEATMLRWQKGGFQ